MTENELRELKKSAHAGLDDIAAYITHVVKGDKSRPARVVQFLAEQIRGGMADIEATQDGFKCTTIANEMDALNAIWQRALGAYHTYLETRVS